MAQVTIYLADEVAAASKRHARKANKSVSAWIADLIERETGARTWPRALLDVLGQGGSDLREPDDPPPDEIEPLR